MIKELSVFKKLGLVPFVSSVLVEKKTVSKVTTNLQINVPFARGMNPWILDDKVLKLLNITITVCTNRKLAELLKTSKKDWTYSGIIESPFIDGKDYHQIIKKIQPSYLNFYVENSTKTTSKVIRTGFIEDSIFNTPTLEHLSVFVAIGIDAKEAALHFKISPTAYKEILGFCSNETFIDNSVFVSKKITDVSILQNTSKFNFKSIKLPPISDFVNNKIYDYRKNSRTNRIFNSEAFYSIDRSSRIVGFFITDILELFKCESSLSALFDNQEFLKTFFSREDYYLPKRIKLARYDEFSNETILYDGAYSSLIETSKVLITKVQFTDGKKLYTSFKDKTSGELTRFYKYRVILDFGDVSSLYLDRILLKLDEFVLNAKKIINIAESGKNFDSVTNSFNSRFYSILERDNLSIKAAILSVYSALSQFSNLSSEDQANIIALSNSKHCNFEVLEQLHNILGFLQTQVSTAKIALSKTNSLDIIVDSFFDAVADKTACLNFKEEVIQTNDSSGYPSISKSDFLKRTSQEINKYYNVSDITNDSKFSYFSPSFFGNNQFPITQDIIDFSALEMYNKALVDIYYRKAVQNNG